MGPKDAIKGIVEYLHKSNTHKTTIEPDNFNFYLLKVLINRTNITEVISEFNNISKFEVEISKNENLILITTHFNNNTFTTLKYGQSYITELQNYNKFLDKLENITKKSFDMIVSTASSYYKFEVILKSVKALNYCFRFEDNSSKDDKNLNRIKQFINTLPKNQLREFKNWVLCEFSYTITSKKAVEIIITYAKIETIKSSTGRYKTIFTKNIDYSTLKTIKVFLTSDNIKNHQLELDTYENA